VSAYEVTLRAGRHSRGVMVAAAELARALWLALGWALLEPRARAARVVAVLAVRGVAAPIVVAGACFLPRQLALGFGYVIVGFGTVADAVVAWVGAL